MSVVGAEFGQCILYFIVSNWATKCRIQGKARDAVDMVECPSQFSTAYTRHGGPHLQSHHSGGRGMQIRSSRSSLARQEVQDQANVQKTLSPKMERAGRMTQSMKHLLCNPEILSLILTLQRSSIVWHRPAIPGLRRHT